MNRMYGRNPVRGRFERRLVGARPPRRIRQTSPPLFLLDQHLIATSILSRLKSVIDRAVHRTALSLHIHRKQETEVP
jgi:hypothetical protein